MIVASERLARIALVLILVGLPLAVFGYQYGLRPLLTTVRTIDIVAATPEAGGFQPDSIDVRRGERVRLRFSVPDVSHGVAIAGKGLDLVQIDPGQVKEVEVVFEQPGVFTFYCNTWCSPNHWRMRGTITVVDPADPLAHRQSDASPEPVIASLAERGIDIDAAPEAAVVPAVAPSAVTGGTWVAHYRSALPGDVLDRHWRQQHSPAAAYQRLREALPRLSAAQRWDIIAHLWTASLADHERLWAQAAFARNCAPCHGETGRGDGPAAPAINAQLRTHAMAMKTQEVAAFVPSPRTMGATTERYYAKLRRGGMGTSMPAFGPLFDSEESWRLAHYLWQLIFSQ